MRVVVGLERDKIDALVGILRQETKQKADKIVLSGQSNVRKVTNMAMCVYASAINLARKQNRTHNTHISIMLI